MRKPIFAGALIVAIAALSACGKEQTDPASDTSMTEAGDSLDNAGTYPSDSASMSADPMSSATTGAGAATGMATDGTAASSTGGATGAATTAP